jgi:hypothetical protein
MACDAVGYPGRGRGTESHMIAGIAVIGKATLPLINADDTDRKP